MRTALNRRLRNGSIAALVAAALFASNHFYDISLRDAAFLNGWMLLVGLAFLSLFNARKKIHVLPVMSMSTWLQIHVYMGLLCIFLFALHTEFSLPNGILEALLWLLFVVAVASGLTGLTLSRIVPRRISARGERMIFERIPAFRHQLCQQAGDLAMESVKGSGSPLIADFYAAELEPYMRQPRNLLAHLLGSNRFERRQRVRFDELRRYLESSGQQTLDEIADLVAAKTNLDHQYALQLVLKVWLFVHIPLSYALIFLTIAHVAAAYAFSAGVP